MQECRIDERRAARNDCPFATPAKCNWESAMQKTLISLLCTIFLLCSLSANTYAALKDTIRFPSEDGLMVTADLYIEENDKSAPFIILYHQAGWSRGEYAEIAPRLNALGFNCIAVDLRSGGKINGVRNHTAHRARQKKKNTSYEHALPDMLRAIELVKKQLSSGKVILWGSSYSASLALKIAGDWPDLVDGVLAFAPGEYFNTHTKTWIQDSSTHITVPTFITSARNEKPSWSDIFDAIPSKHKTSYLPPTPGNHGSRALWKQFPDNGGYWMAVEHFLTSNFKR
jgi:dienelactone hydrolase